MEHRIKFTRVASDINGNPRYAVHYLEFLTLEDSLKLGVMSGYDEALRRAKKIGGKKFHNKQFGGGIVFQSFNTHDTERDIKFLRDNPEVKVRFKVDDDGDVFAVFPDIPHSKDPFMLTCYTMHSEHSACSKLFVRSCKDASKGEYYNLRTHMEKVAGYNLKVLNRG